MLAFISLTPFALVISYITLIAFKKELDTVSTGLTVSFYIIFIKTNLLLLYLDSFFHGTIDK